MIPYKTIIKIDRQSSRPVYLQIANQLIDLIREGTLKPGTKLPGSRPMSLLLDVHRKTIVAGYDELILQGWLETKPQQGTFVHQKLPLLKQQHLSYKQERQESTLVNFSFYKDKHLNRTLSEKMQGWMYLDDGISDERLVPTEDIARLYRQVINKKASQASLTYVSTYGNGELRQELTKYLNATRGLKITKEQVLITRGSQMGIHLSAKLLLGEGDCIIVGETNYISADITFKQTGAKLLRVKVDDEGIETNPISALCEQYQVKAVYITSHHHHPTTVTLSAERRLQLLNLARKFNFAIIEDDYDYDFNYNHAPILPLASHDFSGNVIYIGSVCKTVAPVFRVGYLIGPKDFVDECARQRRYIDRQGDAILELTFAKFIKHGYLDRHIRKVMKIYKVRRDLFCELLNKELGSYMVFNKPKGGMAVWAKLDKKYSWGNVAESAKKYNLEIGEWQRYDSKGIGHNAIRIGFANYTEEEAVEVVGRLKQAIEHLV